MPSLIRLLVVLALIAGAIYGGMLALVTLVEPNPREMSVRIPPDRLKPTP
jgi:predicted histidine transporter YuiF (NhaC family)